MNFVVCIKQVPDATEVKIDPATNTLVREGVPSIINPYDMHALEAALQLRDRYGGRVTALCMGPPQAEEALKKAVSLGADEAVLLSDRAFAGSDTLATSYILASAIEKLRQEEGVDLVVCGKQAIDGDTAQVGPGIAARLSLPLLTYVTEVREIDAQAGDIYAFRKVKNGRELARSRLPALITVVREINEIRYATLEGMIRGARCRCRVWDRQAIGLEESKLGLNGSPTMVRSIFAPPVRRGGEIMPGGTDDPVSAVDLLVKRLVPLKVIPN